MRTLSELEAVFEAPLAGDDHAAAAEALLRASEEVLEHWIVARGETPTSEEREGFRLEAPARFGVVALDEGLGPEEAAPEALKERLAFHLDLSALSARERSIT